MKTHFSNQRYAKRYAEMAAKEEATRPPVPFVKKGTKSKSGSKSRDDDSTESPKTRSVEIRVDPEDPESDTVTTKLTVFEDGTPEEFLRWRMELEEIFSANQLLQFEQKLKMAQTFTRGRAKEVLQDTLGRLTATFASRQRPRAGQTQAVFRDYAQLMSQMTRTMLGKGDAAYSRQVQHLIHYVHLGNLTVAEFTERLHTINNYLPYFPLNKNDQPREQLPEHVLVQILARAIPTKWTVIMSNANLVANEMEWNELKEYLERLEETEKISRNTDDRDGNDKPNKASKRKRDDSDRHRDSKRRRMYCKHCKKTNHNSDDCWFKDKKEGKGKKPDEKKKSNGQKWNAEQFSAMTKAMFQYMKANGDLKPAVKKRPVSADSDEESKHMFHSTANPSDQGNDSASEGEISSDNESSDSEASESAYITSPRIFRNDSLKPLVKRRRTMQLTPEIIVEITDKKGKIVPIRALLDTGTSATLLLRKFIAPGTRKTSESHTTKWTTLGGSFKTTKQAKTIFRMVEFSETREVEWTVHIDDNTDPTKASYNMIIGTDLMTELGLAINFATKRIVWDELEVPLRDRGVLSDEEEKQRLYHLAIQPTIINDAEKRQKRILDADYSAVNTEVAKASG